MKLGQLVPNLLLSSAIVVLVTAPGKSEEILSIKLKKTTGAIDKSVGSARQAPLVTKAQPVEATGKIRLLSEIEHPLKSAQMLLVQSPVPQTSPTSEVVQVTGVKANSTKQGVEVILQTAKAQQLQIINRSAGNSFIADIPNAQLRLPSGEAFTFRAEKPLAGITQITVTNFDAKSIRVSVIGETVVPTVELFDSSNEGLILSIANPQPSMQQEQQPQTQKEPESVEPSSETKPTQPSTQGDEPIELVVTGEQDGYTVPDATTGTRLDVPLLETPASIGTITRELIEDKAARRAEDLIPYISGVSRGAGSSPQGGLLSQFTIRGFSVESQTYINSLRDNTRFQVRDLANIDRIEILKGFSSVLYGNGAPGGVVNYITKKPQATPNYTTSFEAGSFNFYRGEIDLTGPLDRNNNLLYRLIVALQSADSFYDNVEDNRIFIAPSLRWNTGGGGSLTLEAEYLQQSKDFNAGIKFFNDRFFYDRSYTDPRSDSQRDNYRVSAYLDQPLGKNWSLNLGGNYLHTSRDENIFTAFRFSGNTLQNLYREIDDDYTQYNLRGEIRGNFNLGSSQHKLLVGIEYNKFKSEFIGNNRSIFVGRVNVANPIFDTPTPTDLGLAFTSFSNEDYGVYIQDFITLGRFRFLAGLRYAEFRNENNNQTSQEGDYIAPSLGLVYSLTDSLSLYGSYSKSTTPNTGRTPEGFLDPKTATQYEIGAKANFFNDRLSITAALFNLTQTNIGETDRNNPEFNVLVGEIRSRGFEFDMTGKITDNFSLIAAYTLLDAEITENLNNPQLEGNRPVNSPVNSAALWGKYDFTKGTLQGLSLAAGLIYVGDRKGDNANNFDVPSYVRVDLAAAYRIDNLTFRLGIENLFDKRYIESSSDAAQVYQGSPFAVTGSVSVRF
ncbi:TonB-dependent receptor [Scytonema hofmannii PCC 7110]|uniref:TonB-dependent receptor n=1 Tax=Scytonema hofmannii PCC 7110 TaxID=128403 RepID=A0A139WYG8_9CYAN|nr:TonB-dependent siderophore receptor [Scytonema hofmannii]KYC37485.1 TonB-dependent receptor [Scytonema hofmannii PCC 7110]